MRQTEKSSPRKEIEAKEKSEIHAVSAWHSHGMLVERYRFAPQIPVSLAPHCHEQYQIGLSLTDAGEYSYRRAYHPVPVGSVSVIHPGEMHGVCGLGVRPAASVFFSFFVPIDLVQRVLGEAQDRSVVTAPYVPQPIIVDQALEQEFRKLSRLLADPTRLPLERETSIAGAVFALFGTHAESAGQHRIGPAAENAVRRVREFLDAHFAETISYDILARVSGLSAFHLSRSFSKIVGVPPHQYQLQRRIDQAKLLLVGEMPVAEIAVAVGFAQQSHFGGQFRRLVGVSPGQYNRSGHNQRFRSRNLIDQIASGNHA